MLRSDADAPKPPAYPFISINVKERGHKTCSTPELLAYLPSCLQIVVAAFHHRFLRFRSAFPLLFRFGEGAFTSRPRDPQAENDGTMTIFSETPSFRLKSRRYGAPPAIAEGSWVTLPPAIVSAIPVLPSRSTGIASISPSTSTRSAAIPSRKRPVSSSI